MAPDKSGRDALEPSLERFLLTVTSEDRQARRDEPGEGETDCGPAEDSTTFYLRHLSPCCFWGAKSTFRFAGADRELLSRHRPLD